MAITTRRVGDVTVLAVQGNVTVIGGAVELREAVEQALESGSCKLVVNMSGVTGIDSAGISELASSHTLALNKGCQVKLCELPPVVEDVLMVTHLMATLNIYKTESEAIAAFAGE